MQIADGVFCHEVDADDGCRPHGALPALHEIVLIGLLRAEEHGIEHPFHTGALRTRVLSELDSDDLTPGDFGLALWAESRADGSAAEEIVARLERALGKRSSLGR